jgi:putative SOS response-associated peptidase YedK
MCGRYAAFLPAEAIARLFHTVNPLPNVAASWNVAPTQPAMVIRRHPETGERHLDLLQWGLVPSWTKVPAKSQKPINARSETIASSGMFARAFQARRCIVPADAFYEWKVVEGGKQPYAIARIDGAPLAFAGLWEGCRLADGSIIRSFTIVTTRAGDDIAALHERMPVVLEQNDWAGWLGEDATDPTTLLHPSLPGTLRSWPVSRKVNTPRNNSPDLLEPSVAGEPEAAPAAV